MLPRPHVGGEGQPVARGEAFATFCQIIPRPQLLLRGDCRRARGGEGLSRGAGESLPCIWEQQSPKFDSPSSSAVTCDVRASGSKIGFFPWIGRCRQTSGCCGRWRLAALPAPPPYRLTLPGPAAGLRSPLVVPLALSLGQVPGSESYSPANSLETGTFSSVDR